MKNVAIAVLVAIVAGMGFVIIRDNEPTGLDSSRSQSSGVNAPESSSKGKTLNLANNGLREVPKDKLDDGSITVLNVSGNSLTGALPGEIRKLTNLEELNASDNKLTGIPAEIGQLGKLRTADFSGNSITGLPLEIGNLTNLETLDLRGNPNVSAYDISQIQVKIPNAKILVD